MKFKRFVARSLAAFAFVSLAATASASSALAANPAVIIIVNTEQVFQQSKAGASIRTQFADLAKKLQADEKKGRDAIDAEAKKLVDQRALLSKDDLQKKYAALQKKDQDYRAKMQQKSQELEMGANKARADFGAALRPIFQDVMTKHGATILLDQSVVLAGGADLDVTAEVLKALDAKVTSISVKPGTVPAQKDGQ